MKNHSAEYLPKETEVPASVLTQIRRSSTLSKMVSAAFLPLTPGVQSFSGLVPSGAQRFILREKACTLWNQGN
jgi:hypothetical protein